MKPPQGPREAARLREQPDPHELDYPIPKVVLLIASLGLAWAVYDIATSMRDDDPALGDRRSLATLRAAAPGAAGSQAAADGARIYTAQCAACHQAGGAGLPGVFPPLAGSEWVTGSDKVLANIVLQGVTGKLTVKGVAYDGAMPAFRDKLNDAEMAAVLDHIRSSFGNQAAPVPPALVHAERVAGQARSQPWNGDDELSNIK